MSQQSNPNDATPMIKFGVIAVLAFILLILGSCQLVRCACGGSTGGYVLVCPQPGCPGRKVVHSKKVSETCHGAMIPEEDKKKK